MARRDDREYREYLKGEQRRQRGCIARRMQPDFHHGLLGVDRSCAQIQMFELKIQLSGELRVTVR